MNEKIKNLTKNPKLLVVIGLCGILLIFVSSVFSSEDNKSQTKNPTDSTAQTEQYRAEIEKSIKNIVSSITGDKKPTIVVTLESGIKYSYAKADEIDNSVSNGNSSDQSSESKKQSYIIIKKSDGGEEALIVTQTMPEIRGVAIVCANGDNIEISEKIKNAVTAALNITSKRVYISGGTR